jgi:hypothetical protein
MPSKIVPVDKGSKEPQPEASPPEHDCAMGEFSVVLYRLQAYFKTLKKLKA